jgi:hypothetical protein
MMVGAVSWVYLNREWIRFKLSSGESDDPFLSEELS